MSEIKGWKYYNHAAIPTCAPHELPDLCPVTDGSIWQIGGGRALFARWTIDWDCGGETEWWYVIKDTPFDISSIKAKRRYEITKGQRHFLIRLIDPRKYKEEIFKVQIAAFDDYPKKYRPVVLKERLYKEIEEWPRTVYGAFDISTNQLCGYSIILQQGRCLHFVAQKTMPSREREGINAALVYGILEENKELIEKGCYLCDGSRAMLHQTAFQDYLIKYFGFRKSYCKLRIKYRGIIGIIILLCNPMRRIIEKFSDNRFFYQINALLKMDAISRKAKW